MSETPRTLSYGLLFDSHSTIYVRDGNTVEEQDVKWLTGKAFCAMTFSRVHQNKYWKADSYLILSSATAFMVILK